MDITAQPGQTIGRDISRGAIVEAKIDAFISKRHGQHVKAKGERAEEAAWRESERRHEAARREALGQPLGVGRVPPWQAGRCRAVLASLVSYHETEAEKYLPEERKTA